MGRQGLLPAADAAEGLSRDARSPVPASALIYTPVMANRSVRQKRRNDIETTAPNAHGNTETAEPSAHGKSEPWLKRNAYWFWPVLTLVCIPLSKPWLDAQIDARLKDGLASVGSEVKETRSEVRELRKDLSGTGERLTRIEAQFELLRPILQREIKAVVKSAQDLPSGALKQEAPRIVAAIRGARLENVDVPAADIRQIGIRSINASAWQIAAEAVNFQSSKNGAPGNLGPCVDRPITNYQIGPPQFFSDARRRVQMNFMTLHDCVILLDDQHGWKKLEAANQNGEPINAVQFKNCIVQYRGGAPIPIQFAAFESDCVFEFDIPATPSDENVRWLRALLEQPAGSPVRIRSQPA